MSTSSSGLQFDDTSVPSWKQEVNERLAAHRSRRTRRSEGQQELPLLAQEDPAAELSSKAAKVAARVAARYAQAPSYSEVLASVARDQAKAPAIGESRSEAAPAISQRAEKSSAAARSSQPPLAAPAEARRTSQPASRQEAAPSKPLPPAPAPAQSKPEPAQASSRAVEHIQHRDPLFEVEEAVVEPVGTIPANLIEFPRELVAARKARPRLAEGPLREAAIEAEPQLRIFEVEPETISKTPAAAAEPAPEWSQIRLDEEPDEEREAERYSSKRDLGLPLRTASLEDRLMSGLVDLALVLIAFLVFVAVFVACTAHPPTGKPALVAAGAALLAFFLLYQYLFFTFSDGTPGMRYARIALCTFEDDNPPRKRMRQRIVALLLSACPLGLGFLWAWFDEDRLGWHDRITRTYQRSYR